MKTALVCIAKNEDHYIDEWLKYHLKLGFSKVFVYQNNWRYSGDKQVYGDNVEWVEFDGEMMQMKAYNDFIDNRRLDYDFAAFFDVDEFLCLKKFGNLNEFLSNYADNYGIAVNWRLFGDTELTNVQYRNYSVINRFIKAQSILNKHVKTILNLKKCQNFVHFINPHFVDIINGIIDVDKTRFVNGPWNDGCQCESVQLNHYFCKTFEEFKVKIARGKADTCMSHPEYIRKAEEFYAHNFNEVEDLAARNFYNA